MVCAEQRLYSFSWKLLSSQTLPCVPDTKSLTSVRRWMGEPSQITSNRSPATRRKWVRNSITCSPLSESCRAKV